MARMQEADHIGPDPVAWVERLMEVNAGSQFTKAQRTVIDTELRYLRKQLQEGDHGHQSKAG